MDSCTSFAINVPFHDPGKPFGKKLFTYPCGKHTRKPRSRQVVRCDKLRLRKFFIDTIFDFPGMIEHVPGYPAHEITRLPADASTRAALCDFAVRRGF